ncbi:hypothetical protein CASFOL_025968 [Castilleja foliolosa]|uniref:Uncharacterized protein n=1 Tax=Castilleja foliolosa TaxID=1961234 RepID=A0ABD3CTU6_9LAMI
MAGQQFSGDGVPPSLAGMSKNQLYEIMSQMKTLIDQNKQQARHILIQNPVLTRALFQAQIMLGMVQSTQESPSQIPSPQPPPVSNQQSNIQPGKPLAISNQQSNIQPGSSFPGQTVQNQIRNHQQPNQTPNQKPNQNMVPNPHSKSIPINPQPQPTPSRPLQPPQLQQPKAHLGGQSTQMSIPHSPQVHKSTQLPQHSVSQPPSLHQPPMPSMATQSQQPMQNSSSQYIPLQQQLQPPLPPQQRPPMPGFPHQGHAQMGQNNMGFQHPSGPQMHHSQNMFHSGVKPHGGMGPSFQQGQLQHPNQPLPPPLYQGGNPHMGMDFNQSGSSSRQPDRGGPNWTPGLQENTIGQFPGQPSFPGQVGPSNQPPPRPASLAPDMEKQLLQQVMSLTPEQINQLPPEQRNQILQLQQILRQ